MKFQCNENRYLSSELLNILVDVNAIDPIALGKLDQRINWKSRYKYSTGQKTLLWVRILRYICGFDARCASG